MAKVVIFLADGFEEVEGLTVVDLLRRAKIDIAMVSLEHDIQVAGSHGILVKADCLFDEADYNNVDMLILPGGMPGTNHLMGHNGLSRLIHTFEEKEKWMAAICAAPIVLGANGALEGKKATCYPGYENRLHCAEFLEEPVVRDKNIITGRGLGKSIEFACAIIEHLDSKETAEKIKEAIIY